MLSSDILIVSSRYSLFQS